MPEPNSGLDALTSFFIIEYLKKLNNDGKTIVVSAHNLFYLDYICHRVANLRNGDLIVCDTVEAMREALDKRGYEVVLKAAGALFPFRLSTTAAGHWAVSSHPAP